MWRSDPQIPAEATSTSTPSPSGSGTSTTRNAPSTVRTARTTPPLMSQPWRAHTRFPQIADPTVRSAHVEGPAAEHRPAGRRFLRQRPLPHLRLAARARPGAPRHRERPVGHLPLRRRRSHRAGQGDLRLLGDRAGLPAQHSGGPLDHRPGRPPPHAASQCGVASLHPTGHQPVGGPRPRRGHRPAGRRATRRTVRGGRRVGGTPAGPDDRPPARVPGRNVAKAPGVVGANHCPGRRPPLPRPVGDRSRHGVRRRLRRTLRGQEARGHRRLSPGRRHVSLDRPPAPRPRRPRVRPERNDLRLLAPPRRRSRDDADGARPHHGGTGPTTRPVGPAARGRRPDRGH